MLLRGELSSVDKALSSASSSIVSAVASSSSSFVRPCSLRVLLLHAQTAMARALCTAARGDAEAALARMKVAHTTAHVMAKRARGKKYAVWLASPAGEPGMAPASAALDAALVEAQARACVAILLMARKSRIKALYNMRKAWALLRPELSDEELSAALHAPRDGEGRITSGGSGVLDAHPSVLASLILVRGLCGISVSQAPARLASKLMWVLGYDGDRSDALDLLRTVSAAPADAVVDWPLGSLLLAGTLVWYPTGYADKSHELEEAARTLARSLQAYPDAPLFLMLQAQLARATGRARDAVGILQSAWDVFAGSGMMESAPLAIMLEMGISAVVAGDFEMAIGVLTQVVDASRPAPHEFDHSGLAAYALVGAYVLGSRFEEALEVLHAAPECVNPNSLGDKHYGPLAKAALSEGSLGLVVYDVLYLRREMSHLRAPEARAWLRVLDERMARPDSEWGAILTEEGSPSARTKEALFRGVLLGAAGEAGAARTSLESLLEAIESNDDITQSWVEPHAHYELGLLLFRAHAVDAALAHVETALSAANYPWEDALRRRLLLAKHQCHQALHDSAQAQAQAEQAEQVSQ